MFVEFEKYLNESWKDIAFHELKGKNFEEVVNWKIEDGLEINAIYQESDLKNIDYLKHFHQALYNPNAPTVGWRNSQKIKVINEKAANEMALEALNNGVSEIAFELSDMAQTNLNDLLKNILLPFCAISFTCKEKQAIILMENYLTYAKKHNYDLDSLTGTLTIIEEGNRHFDILKNLIEISKNNINILVINLLSRESQVTDRYASLLSEAVKTINSLVGKGLTAEQIIRKIQFTSYISNNYFVEIAGLRALRMLFSEIGKIYKIDYMPYHVHIQAITSVNKDEKTMQEPDWNMLSNTTQAMSAIIGGCNVLSVLPHNEDISEINRFSYRIARNVSNLLAEEAYLDKTADIGAGSYYIDILTDKIAEAIWEKFRKLDN